MLSEYVLLGLFKNEPACVNVFELMSPKWDGGHESGGFSFSFLTHSYYRRSIFSSSALTTFTMFY